VRLPIVDGKVDLRRDFVQSREAFRMYDHGHVLVLAISPSQSVSVAQVKRAVARAVGDMGVVLDASQNGKGTSYTVTVRPHKRMRGNFSSLFADFDVDAI
jgi:hypothetical protein